MKRQPSEWKKIIANETTDKGLTSKIYKQLIQFNTRKITHSKNGEKTSTDISTNKTYRWLTNMKRCSALLIIREMQIKTTMRYHLTLVRMANIKKPAAAATAAKLPQSCPTLCEPTDGSPRLHHPWDFPGKNTRVGCHFLLQCMKVKSESEVAQSCPTLSDPMDCSLPGSSVHGIFQARVLEWGAIDFSHQKAYKQ